MNERLRAVVIGAGWAGEGHTRALRHAGVDVVAICARQAEVVRAVAERLGVPEASTDWQETLQQVRPEIVSVATPASLRLEAIECAAALGCHMLCDKPLGATAEEAERAYRVVVSAGVKHAYAATHRYDPGVVWMAELVRDGAIGALREMVGTFRLSLPPILPWSWALTPAGGGGVLNNQTTHLLGILERISGGEVVAAAGQARRRALKAPYIPGLHDFRDSMAAARQLTPESAAQYAWRDVDVEGEYSALLRIATAGGEIPVAVVSGTGPHAAGESNRLRIYGETGVLVGEGQNSYPNVLRVANGAQEAEALPVPDRLKATLPPIEGDVMNKWGALASDFVADVRGEPHEPYLTFRDGWRYQVVVDTIRGGRGWVDVPKELAAASA